MIRETVHRLRQLCEIITPLLLELPEPDFSAKPGPGKWSKKEILGHLIDSASNNHQRFVRVQFEDKPQISYDQNKWNSFSHHQSMEGRALLLFWQSYNLHLASLIEQIPPSSFKRECYVGDEEKVSLEFIIVDYVRHMEHHLRQIVAYD
jgi:hypothetical protein